MRLKKHNLTAGITLVSLLVFLALFAGKIAPYAYDYTDLRTIYMPPSSAHLLGTDAYGRDAFSRIIYGTRIALEIAVLSVSIQLIIGVTFGLLCGYFGGWVDRILSFIMDITWAIPPIIMAFAVIAIIGKSLTNAVIAISIVSWASYARIVRAKTMAIKNMAFLETGIAFGESTPALLLHYILPNVIPSIIVIASMSIPSAIISTTSLSFLGLGAQSPSPDWGLALSESMRKVTTTPWLSIAPGIALAFTAFSFTLLGEGLRDRLDPRINATK